jgi:hypothetical protein
VADPAATFLPFFQRDPGSMPMTRTVRSGRFVLVAFLSLTRVGLAKGGDITQLFQSANQLYSQGNFKEAIERYRRITESNFVNEVVYYNLANAYFKQNQIGLAILYYEKAGKLAPGDREISENLELARTRIVDKVESSQDSFPVKLVVALTNLLPLDVETALAVTLFVLANSLFGLFVTTRSGRVRRTSMLGIAVLLPVFLIVSVSNIYRIYQLKTDLKAIVVTEKADVLSGPGPDNPTLFSIHEGLKVKVQNQLDQWVQISLENGWTGWIKSDTLGII